MNKGLFSTALFLIVLFNHTLVSSKAEVDLKSLDLTKRYYRKICLTFDDGPRPSTTLRILEILRQKGVRTTFFVVGKVVKEYPDLLKEIDFCGHEIGNHTFSHHQDIRELSSSQLLNEIYENHILIKKITGKDVQFFRPPGAQYDARLIKTAQDKGYKTVLWSVYADDCSHPEPPTICSMISEGVGDQGIILLHTGVEETVQALPTLIDKLKKDGYKFVTISELFEENPSNKYIY